MPEFFYTIFVRKMAEFLHCLPEKNILRDFGGVVGEGNPLAPRLLRLWLGPRPPTSYIRPCEKAFADRKPAYNNTKNSKNNIGGHCIGKRSRV